MTYWRGTYQPGLAKPVTICGMILQVDSWHMDNTLAYGEDINVH
jgi:hypothetical protein